MNTPDPQASCDPLEAVFGAGSVAFVGASNSFTTMGTVQMLNTLRGGFAGRVVPVHPTEKVVLGQSAYPSLRALPAPVDLAVLVVPTRAVLDVVRDAIARGIRHLVITTAGFREGDLEGERREQELVRLAREAGLRFVGPNCIGVINTHTGLNTTFFPYRHAPGPLGLVSQSGTYITQVLDLLSRWGIGLSKAVSIGNAANIDLVDGLSFFAGDDRTRAVGLYVEGIRDGRRFLEAARACTRRKPVVALYVGGTEGGARSGLSHTGALAGADAVYDGAFRQAGVIRARTVAELYQWGWALATQPVPRGARMAVLTHSGGPATSMADAVIRTGLQLPRFSDALREKIRTHLPHTASAGNPVDLTFSMDQALLAETLPRMILEDPDIDGLLMHGLQGSTFYGDLNEFAGDLVAIDTGQMSAYLEAVYQPLLQLPAETNKPIVMSSFFGRRDNVVRMLQDAPIPVYDTPEQAVSAMAALVRYGNYLRSIDR